ncbi:DNA polymerase epsilon subunit 3 [Chironomus tepperi]|uniref:DNA polymerase epsilon subunit 3 n=1 Tax=Chironomus tepperi TaxID=113505 RepID=UPI00391F8BA9
MSDEKITDLQLPLTVVQRIIKDALPPNAIAKQEAKLAIARSASVFILFLTSAATDITSSANQKTISANHVLAALKEIEFESFVPELEKSLENYRNIMKNKKEKKLNDSSVSKTTEKADDEDDVELIDDDD